MTITYRGPIDFANIIYCSSFVNKAHNAQIQVHLPKNMYTPYL